MQEEIVIGNEDRTTPLESYIGDQFDKGWELFVADIIAQNKASNVRLFSVLRNCKGPEFVKDAKKLLKKVGGTCKIGIVRTPQGLLMKDRRWNSFPEIWVDQKQSSIYGNNKPEGILMVRLDGKRYLSFHYWL